MMLYVPLVIMIPSGYGLKINNSGCPIGLTGRKLGVKVLLLKIILSASVLFSFYFLFGFILYLLVKVVDLLIFFAEEDCNND